MKIHAQFSEEIIFPYQVKNFNAYFIENFVVVLSSLYLILTSCEIAQTKKEKVVI